MLLVYVFICAQWSEYSDFGVQSAQHANLWEVCGISERVNIPKEMGTISNTYLINTGGNIYEEGSMMTYGNVFLSVSLLHRKDVVGVVHWEGV